MFNEAFGGYNIPMDPYTCPFHSKNLKYIREKMQLENYFRVKNQAKSVSTYKC